MKVKALRGVCIGVDRHLKPGDIEDLEPALVTFLTGIGAVERVADEPLRIPVSIESVPERAAAERPALPEKTRSKEK
jgi:hypothetical protein